MKHKNMPFAYVQFVKLKLCFVIFWQNDISHIKMKTFVKSRYCKVANSGLSDLTDW